MDIQAKIHNYILKRSRKFTLENIINSTFKNSKESPRTVEDYLSESLYLFSIPEDKNSEKQYIPRDSFFKNAELVVTPSDYEIEKGILFIGHRFIPFYPFDVFPAESFSIIYDEINTISTKSIKHKLENLYSYYSLLGAENIIDDITADHVDNYNLIGNPTQKVNITVFNFKKFYESNSFTSGMSLKFKLEDWNNSVFTVSVNNTKTEEEKEIWFELLEDSLHKVFNEKGQYFDIPEQLALAFFYSGSVILQSPPCSIDDFIHRNENIAVKFVDDNTILWYAENKEPNSSPTGSNDVLSISSGTLTSINDILEELKSDLTSIELEAFIKDAVYFGAEDFKIIIDKCTPYLSNQFKDKAQESAFFIHLEELWENIHDNYNPTESVIGNLRTDILDTLESYYKYKIESEEQKAIEEQENDDSKKHIIEIREILNLLNMNEHDISAEEVIQIEESVLPHLNIINDLI